MSRYRKIDPRIWNDEKFRQLSDHGKLVFLFLLTHPHMTALGAMRATIPGLAAELRLGDQSDPDESLPGSLTESLPVSLPEGYREAFGKAFREALSKGIAKHDEEACFLWLPNFLKYNQPESPNVVKAWVHSFDLLPECELKFELYHRVKAFAEALPKAFGEAFAKAFPKALPEAFAKGMPYQEQEQEQEQERKSAPRFSSSRIGRSGEFKPDYWRKLTLDEIRGTSSKPADEQDKPEEM